MVAGGTATGGGADFTLANGTVKFNVNETVKTVRFPIVNDTRDEADETIRMTLSAPSNATLASAANDVIHVTILDDDAPPSVSFTTTASSGNESVVAPKLTVALSVASGQTVTVPYSVSGGTATHGTDFTLANGTVTFAPGQTTQTIALAIINDLRNEGAETIAVTLGTPANASLGSNVTHTYTIQDNDALSTLPVVNFSAATAEATEPAASVPPTLFNLPAVQLSAAPSKTATVKYTVTGSTATSGSDFTLAAGTLTFTPTGALTQSIPIKLLADALDEADETVKITLSAPTNLQLGTVTDSTLTLHDDADAAPQVAFQLASSTVKEAVKTANLNVTLSAASGQTVTVPYSVTGGTATGDGVDFKLASGTLTFAPGKTTATIPLAVVNDTLHELSETLQVTLGTPTSATLGTNVAHTVTIQDDDAIPKVGFKAATSSISEKLGLDILTVVLSAASSETITVNYAATTGGTATGADFALPAGTLTFAPGETTKNISLFVVEDSLKEANETVKVSLTLPSNATLGTAIHTATITDGGTLPSVKFVAATSTAAESIGQTNVAVALSAATSKVVTVNYSTSGTATNADFSLPSNSVTFQPGETLKNIPINIVDDKLIDPKETILLTLAVPLNATLGATKLHTFTIQDNDPLVGFDVLPPTITVQSPVDGLRTNSNVTITGQVTDDFSGVKTLQARVDGGAASNLSVDVNGFWGITTSLPLNHTADGPHVVALQATDSAGLVSAITSVGFVLDTTPPPAPTLSLSPSSDTGTVGDGETAASRATLVGTTEPQATIVLIETGATTIANASGNFQFSNVSLAIGQNTFTVRAVDDVGNAVQQPATITRVDEPLTGDVVLDWNNQTLAAIQRDAATPPQASRILAMESLAAYDVVRAFDGAPGYYVSLTVPAGASLIAAVAGAAERILSHEFPAQHDFFSDLLATSLAGVPDGSSENDGLEFGRDVADAILALRENDGSRDFVDYNPGSAPGQWQPTAPMFAVALQPQWADLQPFAMTSPGQFRPEGPPSLDSATYAEQLNEVKSLGKATGSTRTAEQTQIARFWADGAGTITPPGHWNEIAQTVAQQQGNSVADNARLFAQLNVALADAAIVVWDAKFSSEFWRPITAIQQADLDGNDATTADPTWSPLLITPPFPEYVSGHSTFSGAAAAVLTSVFGDDVGFTSASPGFLINGQPAQRTFASFEEAANEAGRSRIFGGIHFQEANQDGLAAGHALANFVLDTFNASADTQAPRILLSAPPDGVVTATNVTVTGRVLDNLVGVKSLTVSLSPTSSPQPLTPDSNGNFTFTTTFATNGTADGPHPLNFQATDFAGNVSNLIPLTINLDTRNPVITLTSPIGDADIDVTTLLTGIADGTGSPVAALSYRIDTGTIMPLTFDTITGDFNTTLDLSNIAVGTHTLTLTAKDAAGHVTTLERTVNLVAAIPFEIETVTPLDGEEEVGVTVRPRVFFTRPVDPTSLNSSNLFATDASGNTLPTNIVPSSDGVFVWLFFAAPMPGGSTVTVHVDGSTIHAASDNAPLDADGNGEPGGTREFSFTTVSTAAIPNTTIAGTVVDTGPDLRPMGFDDVRVGPDGRLGTGDDAYQFPIDHVQVYVYGRENEAVFTDEFGHFTLTNVPTGDVQLVVNGLSATNAPAGFYYPELTMDILVEPGRENLVMEGMAKEPGSGAGIRGVYLTRLRTEMLKPVSDTAPTLITVDEESAAELTPQQRPFLTIEVAPRTVVDRNGQPISNPRVGLTTIPREYAFEMLPPGLFEQAFVFTVQSPEAGFFTQPARMTFPNVFNSPSGTQTLLYSADHATGDLVLEGTATVSADGQSVMTDPGTGVTHPGWHIVVPPGKNIAPPPPSEPPPCDPLDVFHCTTGAYNRRNAAALFNVNNFLKCLMNPGISLPEGAPGGLGKAESLLNVGICFKEYLARSQTIEADYLRQLEECRCADSPAELPTPERDLPTESALAALQPLLDSAGNAVLSSFATGSIPVSEVRSQVAGILGQVRATTGNDPVAFVNTLRRNIEFTTEPIGDVPGHPVFFAASLESANGSEYILRGRTTSSAEYNIFVGVNQTLRSVSFYDPITHKFGMVDPNEARSARFALPRVYLHSMSPAYADLDADGLPDIAEIVIGTNFRSRDTDADGIRDLAEVEQGLDPLGGRAFPTGVVASLPLQGSATEIVVEGSERDANQLLAYLATGTHGLAIADVSRFQQPVLLSELDLTGEAVDIAVDSRFGIAAVAATTHFHLIDVTDPTHPRAIQALNIAATQVEIVDGVAYASAGGYIRAIDALTGEFLQSLSQDNVTITGMAHEGSFGARSSQTQRF